MPVVKTAFGRPGPAIEAELGDYTLSKIANDSTVDGDDAAEAMDNLLAEAEARAAIASDLGGTPAAPEVIRLQGRAIHDTDPSEGDRLTWNATASRWEPASSQLGSGPWEILYEVDLTAQGTLAIPGAGVYVIDGHTWEVIGALAVGQELGLSASGLKHSNGAGAASSLVLPAGTTAPSFSLYALPLHQFTGFNADAPIAIQFRMNGNAFGSSTRRCYCGIASINEGAASWNTRDTQMLYGLSTPTATGMGIAGTWVAGTASTDGAANLQGRLYTLVRASQRLGIGGHNAWPGSFPDPNLGDAGAGGGISAITANEPANPSIMFGAAAAAGVSVTGYLTQLRILQPKSS